MLRWILVAVLAVALPVGARAQEHVRTGPCGSSYYQNNAGLQAGTQDTSGAACVSAGRTAIVSASVTRPANTVAYAAGEAVCASTSADCTPLAFPAGKIPDGAGVITGVRLMKSGTVTANASFIIELYDAVPTVVGVHDASSYSPLWADRATYLGYATCSQPVLNADNVAFDCTLSNPAGNLAFKSDASQQIYGMIQASGAYVPSSSEVFEVTLSELQD